MLRPTESPIVFVQQLGRGLRKADEKEYVVILDFIGNYKNNFMISIALSGDHSYNKDNIRRYVLEGGWEFPGGKIEDGETAQQALMREIREELEIEIEVEELLDTVEYDYPNFHLSMDCFICSIKSGELVLKEHEAAKWLIKETLDSVDWLPADQKVVEKMKQWKYRKL